MLLYQVFPHLSTAPSGQPGHPLYIHPNQGYGRFDNPAQYLAWYMASEAASAIGETFADIAVWQDAMFKFPSLPGSRKALGIYDLPDDLPYVDLDDPQQLVDRGVRPSQVVERNRPYTQALALKIYQDAKYKGIRWWSFHRPQWRVWCLWEINPTVAQVDDLTTSHIAVKSAAQTLAKPII